MLTSWEDYKYRAHRACSEPIHAWLLVAFFLLILLRLTHVLGFSSSENSCCLRWLVVTSRWHCQALFGMLFLYFVYWVLRGTVWYYVLKSETKLCFDPKDFSVWILMLYAVIVFYVTVGLIGVMKLLRDNEVEDGYEHLLSQYGELGPPSRVSNRHWEARGLSPRSIASQPVRDISSEEDSVFTCSICLEDIRTGDRVRALRCGHVFHIKCVDEWLAQRAECPNCNQSFREQEEEEDGEFY